MSPRAQPTLGVSLPNYAAADPGDWTGLVDAAKAADRSGMDRVFVTDHVVFGEHLEDYGRPDLGGIVGGRQPTGPDGSWLEPLTTLSVVCGLTSRVRLMTCVLQAALRRPVVLAKSVATLDVLSGGRVDLGVGVGWQRDEYEAAGLNFAERGRRLDDTLAVCRELWRHSPAAYSSDLYAFSSIHCRPQPRQTGGVPIWVSGTVNPAVIRRLVRFGAGWVLWGDHLTDPGPGVARMRAALEQAGRDPAGLRVLGTVVWRGPDGAPVALEDAMSAIPDLVEAGVTDFRIAPPLPPGLEAASDFLAEVRSRFDSVTGP